jgi:hypothetical protein
MLIPALVLLAVVSVPLAGGRLERLPQLRFVSLWALLAGLAIQVLILEVLPTTDAVGFALLHVASYVLVGWFVWRNRAIRELWIIGAGGLANFAAIATNGGVMPAHPEAWAAAGLPEPVGFANSHISTDAPLWFLGDVFAVPAGWPLANVFSIGDVLLVAGLFVLLHRTGASRLAPRARRLALSREPGVPAER